MTACQSPNSFPPCFPTDSPKTEEVSKTAGAKGRPTSRSGGGKKLEQIPTQSGGSEGTKPVAWLKVWPADRVASWLVYPE
ncbi:hypothetical protein COY13_00130 [Candidatus Roizmanbacteria bacterium CG_4_10_14_0_2_um_filter_36_35]|uniref:Uncharacterized protein n=3 Tax=Candidatus Roizmaniibacteriota TaxID=1752723 RepID=A0A2M7BW92_9BACT|nr:MAG: hypothetical protein COV86_00650 [Candidatus Roizmanbacteria bacterium CG11_big_fil_rev_8_21_14_0_20_35_14]PIV10799.1 MAG: hypothetical protein COS50_03510 [Candidatus Roizmanbacteria bacterium CG03_land_8_20_14_0_80_35_26]PIZ68969.1 MAG: hypothetical protein COY13_00130 [Candidatus Roizmanbacteria bacterium CG_4_10_14_0_2_um_filter_36_35]